MSDNKPNECGWCHAPGSYLDGPHGAVFFCNGCGKTVDSNGIPVDPKRPASASRNRHPEGVVSPGGR